MPTGKSSGYLPSLDGLRAIAILAVIMFHDQIHTFGLFSTRWIHMYGAFGVDLFFAISGILICTRLLEEERVTGAISLKAFYLRRLYRISPAAWAFLLSYTGIALCGQLPLDRNGIITSFLMVRNLRYICWGTPGRTPGIRFISRSLSVEEHFYFLLPGLLVLYKRKRAMVLGGLGILTGCWVVVCDHYQLLRGTGYELRTDTRIDELLIPAMIAVLLTKPHFKAWSIRWVHPWVTFPVLVLLFILFHPDNRSIQDELLQIMRPILLPLLVVSTILSSKID